MKQILIIGIFGFLIIMGFNSCNHVQKQKFDFNKLKNKANEANTFCKKNNLNSEFFVLIDLSMHSGLNRFFIWDFKKNNISYCCLVSHGCCNYSWRGTFSKEKAGISNSDGSHCSSLGKYIIGERGYSNWGIHVKYLLHGLESSNRNSINRQVVLHSWDAIEDDEVFPNGTPEGWGCPAISNNSMKIVDRKLRNSNKKVLMWVIQ